MIGLLDSFGFDGRPRGFRRHDHAVLGCSYRELGRKRRDLADAHFEFLHREGSEIQCLEAQRVHSRREMTEDELADIGRHRFPCYATALVKSGDGHVLDHGHGLVVDETPDATRVRLRAQGKASNHRERCDVEEPKRDRHGADESGMHFRDCVVRSGMRGSMQHIGDSTIAALLRAPRNTHRLLGPALERPPISQKAQRAKSETVREPSRACSPHQTAYNCSVRWEKRKRVIKPGTSAAWRSFSATVATTRWVLHRAVICAFEAQRNPGEHDRRRTTAPGRNGI